MEQKTDKPLHTPASLHFSPALLEFVDGMDRVDILSTTTMSLLREISAGDLSTKQLANKIARDPTLSASLLKLANSAYYGIPNKVSTVSHAVSLLGFTAVRNLVQGLCLMDLNPLDKDLDSAERGRKFGAHSMAVSSIAGILTKKFGFPTMGQGEAETAGLLHDIGFLLMDAAKKEEFRTLFETRGKADGEQAEATFEAMQILALERSLFGFTHPELGAWLAQRWNLPLLIQEALMYHHGDISDCIHREAATIIQLANLLCNENEMGYIPEGYWGDADPSVLRFLDSQRKLELYETFPHSLENDLRNVRVLYDFVLLGMKEPPKPIGEPARPALESSESTEKKRTSSTPSKVPAWSYLAPGVPQLLAGKPGVGWAFLAFFLVSILILGYGFWVGSMGVGIGGLVLAGIVWVVSILST